MPAPDTRSRRRLAVAVAIVGLAIAGIFGVINGAIYRGEPLRTDTDWMAAAGPGQSTWLVPSLFLHQIGFGVPAFVLACVVGGALFLWSRPWGATYFLAAAVASTALVGLLKAGIGRPRPPEALVDLGSGSYPSGHSARAAVLAVTLGILVPRFWVWMLGSAYTLAMMFSRTQLGAHWLSDTIGGAIVGGAVALLCFALLSEQLRNEGERAHPPPWRSGM